jgi:hypothetical protein
MIPSVPSDPTKSCVKLNPAEVFRALMLMPEVWMTDPSAQTTSKLSAFSFIVPYRTAFVPLAPVAHIPHIEASAPGSMGNHKPEVD